MILDTFLYHIWLKKHKPISNEKNEYCPLISIIMPVYNVKTGFLKSAIKSVLKQSYNNFELIIVDDCSTNKKIRKILSGYKSENIRVIFRDKNGGISEATNTGINHSNGEFISFVDCDDTIEKNALKLFVTELNKNKKIDFLYSDEDKITEKLSIRYSPFFKPDWSKDTFLSMNYTNHLSMYRSSIVKKIGLLNKKFDGSQDYDFVLRLIGQIDSKNIAHIPAILYHWRAVKGSTAKSINYKKYTLSSTIKCKENYLKRNNINADIYLDKNINQSYFRYCIKGNPLVSIIIPSKNNFLILKKCIDSIINLTDYNNYELVVVDNGSNKNQRELIHKYLNKISKRNKYLYKIEDFNYSKMINRALKECKGDYIVTLNDDVQVCSNSWLKIMLGQCQQKSVGIVGIKLLYNYDQLIQHIGVFLHKGEPLHIFCKFSDSNPLYYCINRIPINCLAVTGACSMFSKSLVNRIGLLDENLPIAYNDVDFCLRAYENGYINVCRNDVYLYHHESYSRGYDSESSEKKSRLLNELMFLKKKHCSILDRDPYLNINVLSYDSLFINDLPWLYVFIYRGIKFLRSENKIKKIFFKLKRH